MSYRSSISFEVIELERGGPKEMHSKIDANFLAKLVETDETSAAYDPAGGYAGIVADYFDCGNLRDYWLGANSEGCQYLLGCQCGEAGCWPFVGHIEIQGEDVVWSQFSQPYRRERDYSGFGPFRFSLSAYIEALNAALRSLSCVEDQT